MHGSIAELTRTVSAKVLGVQSKYTFSGRSAMFRQCFSTPESHGEPASSASGKRLGLEGNLPVKSLTVNILQKWTPLQGYQEETKYVPRLYCPSKPKTSIMDQN